MKVLGSGTPIAGGGRGRERTERLQRALERRGHDGEVVLQHHGLHAGEEAEAQVGTFLGHRPVAVPRNT